MPKKRSDQFNREAFVELLARSNYPSPSDFARQAGISPGALHDITAINPISGKVRRQPSLAMIKKLAAELRVPLTALLRDPALVANAAA